MDVRDISIQADAPEPRRRRPSSASWGWVLLVPMLAAMGWASLEATQFAQEQRAWAVASRAAQVQSAERLERLETALAQLREQHAQTAQQVQTLVEELSAKQAEVERLKSGAPAP